MHWSSSKFLQRLNLAVANETAYRIPKDVDLARLCEQLPAAYDILAGGAKASQTKHSHFINRAIWHNQLDKMHTFSTSFRNCHDNVALVGFALDEGKKDEVPELLLDYYYATRECYRHDHGVKDGFSKREKFIEKWMKSGTDIHIFTKKQSEKFDDFAKQLRAALPVVSPPPEVVNHGAHGAAEDEGAAEDDGAEEDGGAEEEQGDIDVAMQDPPEWKMGGLAYRRVMDEDVVDEYDRPVSQDDKHCDWVLMTIAAIGEAIDELERRRPRPNDRILRLCARIVHMGEETLMTRELNRAWL